MNPLITVYSGGLLLKFPGRVGEVSSLRSLPDAIFPVIDARIGSNLRGRVLVVAADIMQCIRYAQLSHKYPNILTTSLKGCGEYIIRTALAKTIGDAIQASPDVDVHDILHRVLTNFYGWSTVSLRHTIQ